ncbi:uncharacterized protein TNCV_3774531 [Trichonephila clavipes]|nr:uncharacterized protein TNCV_3774531 [Trichonephila clavipes]
MSPVELPHVPIVLNETFTKLLWGTDAEKSFISEEIYRKYFFHKSVKKSRTQVIMAQGAKCQNIGIVELNIRVEDIKVDEGNLRSNVSETKLNVVANVSDKNPVESIIGEKVNCTIIRDLVLSSREQLIEEQRTDPELGHIYRYLENPQKIAQLMRQYKLVMVSDGTEYAVGDIERLFEEARRNTKAKHGKWEKYYNRRRRDVQIKEND